MGPPPGGHYGRPQPKKSSPWLWISLGCGGLFVIGVVLVVLLVFVLGDEPEDEGGTTGGGSEGTGGGGNGGSAGVDTDSGLGNEPRSNPDMPGIGETVEHEGLRFTITQIDSGLPEAGSHTPVGEYVAVWIEVEPAGSSAEDFWRDEQHLYTYDGQEIEEDYEATWDYTEDSMLIALEPGESYETVIVFDVDDPSQISHMGLSAETLGGNEVEVDVTG
ncbi:DUF4352 domain-containing protein [Nocardiopsis listeri]|uniref:DUF4352 domain-containing protein n=1 Tax=Nocardiopsis listeri TaxID=53440 RepID=UPI001CC1EB04|nr:DUF4352 domain-containing protein [Nocardiopsis listeri]